MDQVKIYMSVDEGIQRLNYYSGQLFDMRFGPSVSEYWCKSYLENYLRTEKVLFFEYCSADNSSRCLFPGRDFGNGEVRLLFKETADYQDVLSVGRPQEGLQNIISSMFSAGFHTITLDKLHSESPTVRTVIALENVNGMSVLRHGCDRMPIVRIQRNSDVRLWDNVNKQAVCAYWNKLRRLSRKAHVEFRIITDFAELLPLLDRMFAMHITRWEHMQTKSKFSQIERRAFTRQICEEASKRGELFVPVLFIDGTLASYRLSFRRGRVIYDWIPSYATEFRPHSVGGILLLQMFVALSRDDEIDEYNFMRGEEPYKLEWTQTITETLTLVIKK